MVPPPPFLRKILDPPLMELHDPPRMKLLGHKLSLSPSLAAITQFSLLHQRVLAYHQTQGKRDIEL